MGVIFVGISNLGQIVKISYMALKTSGDRSGFCISHDSHDRHL